MKRVSKKIIAIVLAAVLCMAAGVLFAACGETGEPSVPPVAEAPVKVKDGETFELAYAADREFAVADYITAYGNAVTAQSNAAGVASAAVEDGTLTITAVSEGETTVTLTCGDVTVTFTVTVYRT